MMDQPVIVVVEDGNGPRTQLLRLCLDRKLAVPDDIQDLQDAPAGIRAIRRYHNANRLIGVIVDIELAASTTGWDVIKEARAISPTLPLAIVSAFTETDPIVQVIASGAADPRFRIFEKKEITTGPVGNWIDDCIRRHQDRLTLALSDTPSAELYHKVAPIYARSTLPILVVGESGTGKESLANHIHNLSGRPGPFIPVNCGALEDTLALADFFGHQQGAYTDAATNDLGLILRASGYQAPKDQSSKSEDFESWLKRGTSDLRQASSAGEERVLESTKASQNAGTIFLDEVGAASPKVMAGLLRLLSSGIVRPVGFRGLGIRAYCRVIAATNEMHKLRSASQDRVAREPDSFRADLYYRLAGAVLELLPLSQRSKSDIAGFMQNDAVWRDFNLGRLEVSQEAIDLVTDFYHRREVGVFRELRGGNFRTLRSLLHRAALLAAADGAQRVEAEHIHLALKHGTLHVKDPDGPVGELGDDLAHIKEVFTDALNRYGGVTNVSVSADELKSLSVAAPIAFSAACLECLCTPMIRPTARRTYYEQKDVEVALRGFDTRTVFSKLITLENAKAAAMQYFGLQETELAELSTISKIASVIRQKRRTEASA